jgi:hypothetical protein
MRMAVSPAVVESDPVEGWDARFCNGLRRFPCVCFYVRLRSVRLTRIVRWNLEIVYIYPWLLSGCRNQSALAGCWDPYDILRNGTYRLYCRRGIGDLTVFEHGIRGGSVAILW